MSRGQLAEKKRSRRIYVMWAIALALLLALGLLCWKVVVPVWQVRKAVRSCSRSLFVYMGNRPAGASLGGDAGATENGAAWTVALDRRIARTVFIDRESMRREIENLGGSRRAAERLGHYLHLPRWVAPDRQAAAFMLGYCGRAGVPRLIDALADDDPGVRRRAAEVSGHIGPDAEEAVPALVKAIKVEDWELRAHATQSLGDIGTGSAARALRRAARSEDPLVRALAAKALEKLQATKQQQERQTDE